MKYIKEVGAVMDRDDKILSFVEGSPTHVDFPEELIWQLHKMSPGIVYKLAHTHPPGMTELSGRDEKTLKTWGIALYPFPIRMSTITINTDGYFIETVYTCFVEPKEIWKKRGEVRKIDIMKVDEPVYHYKGIDNFLINQSYNI